MKWNRGIKRFLTFCLAGAVGLTGVLPGFEISAYAGYADISNNEFIHTDKSPSGKTGKIMSIPLIITNNGEFEDDENIWVSISPDNDFYGDKTDDSSNLSDDFPFEIGQDTFNERKKVGKIKDGQSKHVTLSARVRRDLSDGYYRVNIRIEGENSGYRDEWINIWIKKSTDTSDDDDIDDGTVDFVLGEGQSTPDGTYPHVMDFKINMRNASKLELYDVTVSLELSEDKDKYPFEINDVNYDRRFDKIEAGQTVELPYSMAIRSDVYTGYYPIKTKIYYRDSSNGSGPFESVERTFYVRVHNKEKEDDLGEFDKNDRTMARLVVDRFETVPETIIAGEEFELILHMKNASSDIAATNILFAFESEKVSDSAIFSMESGASSVTVNRLNPGETTELRMKMSSGAGVDQRSYALTIKETYDSPEFKNAEATVSIDIPVKQIARMNIGTFEIMPDTITVGSESNVMFPINNTGKVILYNVMVHFEADSINPADAYVGNIKPGESGNVDVMLTGIAPTADDGTIPITISYEDENGTVTEIEKSLLLNVIEQMPEENWDIEAGNMDDLEADSGFFGKHKIAVTVVLCGAFLAFAAVFVELKRRKKKKQEEEEKEIEDEIS